MTHHIHIHDGPSPPPLLPDAEAVDPTSESGVGATDDAPAVESGGVAPEGASEDTSRDVAATADTRRRARRRKIFLLLALALVAAPLADAALATAVGHHDGREAREYHIGGIERHWYDEPVAGPMASGAHFQSPPAGPLGHSPIPSTCAATRCPICCLDVRIDLFPPAVTLRGRVAAVLTPEIRITARSLARVVLGRWMR
jgi:hypothetical protein